MSNVKTPITYWGGKQTMLRHILPRIPEHTTYCEPFFGGGAVFWANSPLALMLSILTLSVAGASASPRACYSRWLCQQKS